MGRGKREVKNSNVIAGVLITAVLTALQDAMATEYTVGDATGWDFAPTSSYYSDWATGLKFLPGDKLGTLRIPLFLLRNSIPSERSYIAILACLYK